MRVYLAEKSVRYDITALDAYGPIEYVSEYPLNPFNTTETMSKLKAGLKDFDPTEDYICMTGNLQTVALMMMIAYSLFDTFKVLSFDARNSNYKERIISHV